uniref:spidroin-2-like n=1 Tax=Nyctereutes procyonoides TaxID=34880 RepID=UPI00244516C3|nr:spidroin-2-like [Nyctereutes procyonoides]
MDGRTQEAGTPRPPQPHPEPAAPCVRPTAPGAAPRSPRSCRSSAAASGRASAGSARSLLGAAPATAELGARSGHAGTGPRARRRRAASQGTADRAPRTGRRGPGHRRPGHRGPGHRRPGTADQGTADQGTADQGTADRAPQTRAPRTRAPQTGHRRPGHRGPGHRRPGTADQGTADQGTADQGTADRAPQTRAPQTRAPRTRAPRTSAPQTRAPQTRTPQTGHRRPGHRRPGTADQGTADQGTADRAPRTRAPQTRAPQTRAPRTRAPRTGHREPGAADQGTADRAPQTRAPQTGRREPGAADQGTADQGTADRAPRTGRRGPGTADQGTADQGTADQGTADQGTADRAPQTRHRGPGHRKQGTGAPPPPPRPPPPLAPSPPPPRPRPRFAPSPTPHPPPDGAPGGCSLELRGPRGHALHASDWGGGGARPVSQGRSAGLRARLRRTPGTWELGPGRREGPPELGRGSLGPRRLPRAGNACRCSRPQGPRAQGPSQADEAAWPLWAELLGEAPGDAASGSGLGGRAPVSPALCNVPRRRGRGDGRLLERPEQERVGAAASRLSARLAGGWGSGAERAGGWSLGQTTQDITDKKMPQGPGDPPWRRRQEQGASHPAPCPFPPGPPGLCPASRLPRLPDCSGTDPLPSGLGPGPASGLHDASRGSGQVWTLRLCRGAGVDAAPVSRPQQKRPGPCAPSYRPSVRRAPQKQCGNASGGDTWCPRGPGGLTAALPPPGPPPLGAAGTRALDALERRLQELERREVLGPVDL